MQETRSEARNQRAGGGLEERFQSATPTTRYEYVDVFFETAGVDTPVTHSLRPQYPNQVNYEVVQITAPALVYHDGSANRRSWMADTIFLRSNVSTVWARIRVSLPSDDAGQRQGSVNAVDPGATFVPDDLAVTGDLAVLGSAGITGAVNIDGALDVDAAADIQGILTTQAGINNTGGQIAFPAVQAASAGANTLDDYEEGTFVPVLAFGGASTGITYGTQTADYVKVGRNVLVNIRITLTSDGTATGAATITGLPFTASGRAVGSGLKATMAAAFTGGLLPWIESGTAVLTLYQTTAVSDSPVDETLFTDTALMIITISYYASA